MADVCNVEIFATGAHHPGEKPFTTADLDAMVEAFHALDFKPAVKIGHTDEAGAPAYGWVENLRREGQKLVADLVQLPDDLYQMIKNMRFDRVSAELAFNFERAGRKFAKVLTALALLGQELPAVAGLKPLHASFSVGPLGEGAQHFERTFSLSTTKELDMTKEELEARDAKLRAELEAKFAAERAADAAKYKAEKDAADARYATERAAEQARITALETANRKAKVDGIIASCKFAALRPMIGILAEIAINQPATAKYTVGDKKDLSTEAVLTELISEVNTKVVKLFTVTTAGAGGAAGVAEDESNDDTGAMTRAEVSERVDTLTKKHMTDNKVTDYAKAMRAVLEANAELKAAYTARSKAA